PLSGMVDWKRLFALLSLVGFASSIILTGTIICDTGNPNDKVNVTANISIGTIKDKNVHHNGDHTMKLTRNYWSEYLLSVKTTKSWLFQDEVSLEIKIEHDCVNNNPKIGCYYIEKKSDFNVIRSHIRLLEMKKSAAGAADKEPFSLLSLPTLEDCRTFDQA
ncbi:hypothetical protein PENTCL1PPCAC_22053, partial [Pristionchus entomophagus]